MLPELVDAPVAVSVSPEPVTFRVPPFANAPATDIVLPLLDLPIVISLPEAIVNAPKSVSLSAEPPTTIPPGPVTVIAPADTLSLAPSKAIANVSLAPV